MDLARWSIGLGAAALAGCSAPTAPVPTASTAPADGGSPATWTTKAIDSGPSYRGSVDDGAACSAPYSTIGFEPVDPPATRHPLMLYFVGTSFVSSDASSRFDSQAALKVTEAMARRGFVALSAEYDNSVTALLSDHQNQLACLFGASNATNLVAQACSMPRVDCDLGVAVWGHSLGAYVAVMASHYDARVRGAWLTGYGGNAQPTLSTSRLRVVNGAADTGNASVPLLDGITGQSATECPDDGRDECLRADGSGWIIVEPKDCAVTSADHCWFDKRSCADSAEVLEPNWIDPASTKPFALESNADWLARTARRP